MKEKFDDNQKGGKIKKGKNDENQGESSTKTGEFICSYFDWITLDKQKDKVEELEDITKNGKGN